MNYSFEGNVSRRREQNLSGASRKDSREVLLRRAHFERQKREEQRRKFNSSLLIQACIRSYLVRQRIKKEERLSFDITESSCEDVASLKILLRKLLFIFKAKQDLPRLYKICKTLLKQSKQILQLIDHDQSLNWLLRKTLVTCLTVLHNVETVHLYLQCLDTFTVQSNSRQKLEIWPFLVKNGYFKQLRELIDSGIEVECSLKLVNRPLVFLNLIASTHRTEIILSEFCTHFLCPNVTETAKNVIIPSLKSYHKFPYDELMRFLNSSNNLVFTNNLLYSVLSLEPIYFEPTLESLQVLSSLSLNLYNISSLIEISDDDDSDVEEMETSEDKLVPQDFMVLLNNQDRVKKILNFFDHNNENEQVLQSVTELCHNLLLCFKDSIHKYMLVYMLSLRGTFLYRLWCSINAHQKQETLVNEYSSSITMWTSVQTSISVFCSLFTLYTSTLTDTENDSASSSGIFSNEDLCNICEILRNLSLNLIDIAFPMCRSSMVPATPELIHLYKYCLNALRVLHILDLRKHFCKSGFWTRKKIHISQDLGKRDYLSKTLRPFFGIVAEDEDEYLPPLLTVEQRSLAILQELPFLVEFNSRVLLLRDLCRSSIMPSGYGLNHRDFMADSAVVIRRTHLYEDAFEKLSPENEPDLKQKVRIQFINNAGLDEPGIDGGGIFKEFINEVLKTAFDPNRGFFFLTNDNLLYPNPNVHLIVEDFGRHYFFIGRLAGKALFENILVDLPLAEFFLEKLIVERVDAHHLRSLDPVLYRNLLYLRDYSGDVQDLGLDFTTASNDLGETRVIELKPNGRNIPVTNYNRLEYIHLLADFKLNKQIKRQCAAFRQGLNSVVPLLWLKLFNHRELQIIIGGDMQEMDINDLKNHTAYGGDFTAEHPTILIFWKIVESFTDAQKKQLLKFVTSCSRPPLLGFKELTPSFCIQSAGSEDRMPTASTCLNLLKLPVINLETVLRDKLLQAIEQQAGFELS